MKELLILSPVDLDNNKPTKILDKNLNKIQSFTSGYKFNFDFVEGATIHDAMKSIFENTSCFMVLGELTDYGKELYSSSTAGPRRKKKGRPTIEDRDGSELVLDLDDHKLKGFDPLDPVPAIKKWLKKKKIKCDVTWQITSSQKLNSDNARIRLYFEANKEHTLRDRKAWSQSPDIMADGCVYTCSQPIYTAPPIILKGRDPIKVRTGFIKGKQRTIGLPDIPEEIKTQYVGFSRGGDDFDYEDPKLPKEVLSGKVYRRYFMPMAFHYVNKLGTDRDAIFAIIATKAVQITDREFDEENTYAYIDDAIDKWQDEQSEKPENVVTSTDIKNEAAIEEVPEFPINVMEAWPAPWPMIWKNLKKVPRELTEELLVPTILSLNSFMLQANFVSSMKRRPNMFFLNLTPSTGNKDVNSKNVIEDLDDIFKKKGSLKVSPFTDIINGESAITADTSFLQCFDDDENLFWVNTEATRIFHQLSSSGNSNVSALADKLIEVVDGRKISGKKKSGQGQSVGEIKDPNCQVLFYAQPETIERYITSETVDSGLFGRTMVSLIPNLKFDAEEFSIFMHEGSENKQVEDDFYNFYMSNQMMLNKTEDKTVLAPTDAGVELLHEWSKEFLFPLMQTDEVLQKVLKRMGIAAEQLYIIIMGVCRQYDLYIGKKKPRKNIDVRCMLPLLEYWAQTKVYTIREFVNTTLDPLAEDIMNLIKECLVGKYSKKMSIEEKNLLKTQNMVSVGLLKIMLRNRPVLIRKLTANNDNRNATERATRIINTMVKDGILISKDIGSKTFVGIAKR